MRYPRVSGSRFFFDGYTEETGWEPWVSDGAAAGTHMITEILPGTAGSLDHPYARGATPLADGSVLFPANDGVHGREFWVSDGTAAGTHMLRDVLPGAKGAFDVGLPYLTAFAGRAFFVTGDVTHGAELWSTDGTDGGTSLFADLELGSNGSYPSNLTLAGGKLYFLTTQGPLWMTDGTPAGTHAIGTDRHLTASTLTAVDDKVYFAGSDPLTGGEPWVTDGTEEGTRMFANLAADPTPSGNPRGLVATRNLLYFYASEGYSYISNTLTTSVWRSDGTAAGTFKLADPANDYGSIAAAGELAFFSKPVGSVSKAFVSDGTLAGTQVAADTFFRRFGDGTASAFMPFGDTLFVAYRPQGDFYDSLYVTTPAANAPAVLLGRTLSPGAMTPFAGRYAFFSTATQNPKLWMTDGTPTGTYAVVPDLGQTSQGLGPMIAAGGSLYFFKTLSSEKTKLWKSDGTVAVKEVAVGSVKDFVAVGRRVFFADRNSLWVSDGTADGAFVLPQVQPDDLNPHRLFAVGNGVVFTQWTQGDYFSLWFTDGTVDGTKKLMQLGQPYPELVAIEGRAYFAGTDDVHGTEVWTTDGTVEGTKLLADVNPGPASSGPNEFTKLGNNIYFSATTPATGNELWALPLTESTVSIADTRVIEGDATAHFTVTLSRPAAANVTVAYSTSDGTAHAGEDYDAASGTLSFAAGETVKTIDVNVRADALAENNETFFVTLRDATGARLVTAEGAGIVEDDDGAADLGVAFKVGMGGNGGVYGFAQVTNNGPRAATDVVVNLTSTPWLNGCVNCSIPQLVSGASADVAADTPYASQQEYFSAVASSRLRDPQASNNSVAWTSNSRYTMVMSPPYLVTGGTATVTIISGAATPLITSSDPTVIAVPSSLTKGSNNIYSFKVTGLKAGSSTLKLDNDTAQSPLLVTVLAPGAQPRWPGGLTIETDFTATRFTKPLYASITPSGTAPLTGARPTGTVIVTVAGREMGRQTISGTSTIKFPFYFPSVGQLNYSIAYSGDANFLPQTFDSMVAVYAGDVTLTGELKPVPNAPGTFALTVRATGAPATPPSGSIGIVSGGGEITRLLLVAGAGFSEAQTTLTNLPPSPTITLNYAPSDTLYSSATQQLRVTEARRRVATH
jgi:ELWxxDGT repeat protein